MSADQRKLSRSELWKQFDEAIAAWKARKLAPAFIQEVVIGLWSVQVLCHRDPPQFGYIHRLLNDPPPASRFEPFYNGWPGDHRGWMRFASKESARDLYKLDTGLISFEEFQKLDHPPLSNVYIDLDERGDFVAESASVHD